MVYSICTECVEKKQIILQLKLSVWLNWLSLQLFEKYYIICFYRSNIDYFYYINLITNNY